jgi:hypothetical protein
MQLMGAIGHLGHGVLAGSTRHVWAVGGEALQPRCREGEGKYLGPVRAV